ncbi:DUF3566 domain-containing protein [Actinomadura sp. 6N118]|uniref:DUF3566 domain-containing protein n=1 Tax=Actinomadura sp. 6N118 TaxID=3375151 RepID=UPI003791BA3D
MSTQPGKGKGRSGGTGKGSGSSSGSSGSSAGAKKTVPAAKPGRDEATVEITPVKPAMDETTPDLGSKATPADGKSSEAKPADSKPKDLDQTRVDATIDIEADLPKLPASSGGSGKSSASAAPGKPSGPAGGAAKPSSASSPGGPAKPSGASASGGAAASGSAAAPSSTVGTGNASRPGNASGPGSASKSGGAGRPGSAGKPGGPGEPGDLPGKPAASPVIPPVQDTSVDNGPAWSRSPETGGGRDKPFGRREVGGSGSGPGPAAGGASAASASPGFAGTALKDRPAQTSANPSGSTKPSSTKAARKAQLQLARLEPWSVMKFSFVMSLVCFVVLLVAVVVLYMILSGLGVFDSISGTIDELTRDPSKADGGLDAGNWFSFARIFGYTVLVGALNVLLITALSTVGAVIYNLAADLVGGVEVTLKEAE